MAGWLIFVISCVASIAVAILSVWAGEIAFTNT